MAAAPLVLAATTSPAPFAGPKPTVLPTDTLAIFAAAAEAENNLVVECREDLLLATPCSRGPVETSPYAQWAESKTMAAENFMVCNVIVQEYVSMNDK